MPALENRWYEKSVYKCCLFFPKQPLPPLKFEYTKIWIWFFKPFLEFCRVSACRTLLQAALHLYLISDWFRVLFFGVLFRHPWSQRFFQRISLSKSKGWFLLCGHWRPLGFLLPSDTNLSGWGSLYPWGLERERRKQISLHAQGSKAATWSWLHRQLDKIVSLKLI